MRRGRWWPSFGTGGAAMSDVDPLSNPILNSPYGAPERHFAIGPAGPTGEIRVGRRPSESFIPVPATKKGRKAKDGSQQDALDFDLTGERIEENSLINDIRQRVETWRNRGYPGVEPMSRKLLEHWAGTFGDREDKMLFCQREAAETAIYLAEVAGRRGEPEIRSRLAEANDAHNDGLPRIALKMATGSGKTVVMAMLIAWQTINKVNKPRDSRYSKRFLIVAPGITIRDRLRVLKPTADDNYYVQRDLVPDDLWPHLQEAQIVITNYHTFLLRDAPEIKGVAANTRKILNAGKSVDPFKETPEDMVSRVLRGFGARAAKEGGIVVINDEAHHCYRDRPLDAGGEGEAADRDDKGRNEDARKWFKGLQAVAKKVGIKAVYDLSATPFYLKGSGYNEGFIFPWVVSDFSLMDAIESGIVKVPRVPVDDDAIGDLPSYLNLWDHVDKELPKKAPKDQHPADWVPPKVLEGALESLHRSYTKRFEEWERHLRDLGEPPPVMIVVCPNTTVSKLVFDWVAGVDVERDDETPVPKAGHLDLLSNVVDGAWLSRPRTILVDSAAMESGEAFSKDFKDAARDEVERFKHEYVQQNPGADADKITDEDLLREVMNTIGKRGKLGEQIRCVVSVSMLTEGWDANTVTHILGVRAFRSQLLCEQVVGRGLRRRSYAPNEQGRFEPEYADVYGVPFAFLPSDRPAPTPQPQRPATPVYAVDGREDLEIRFPRLEGYRVEVPEKPLVPDFGEDARFHVARDEVAVWVRSEGIAGAGEDIDIERYRHARRKEVAFRIAALLVHRFEDHGPPRVTRQDDGDLVIAEPPGRPWLFTQLIGIVDRWLRECVTFEDGAFVGLLLPAQAAHRAAEKVYDSVVRTLDQEGNDRLLPRFRIFDPEGSTADVNFTTRKVVIPATRSQVNAVVLDGIKGNSWEESVAGILEGHRLVHSFVKNDHLDFRIPYVHQGRTHDYVPDFLVRLVPGDDGVDRTLIVEVSGTHKPAGPTAAKADATRNQWCPAVNNHGAWGRWAYAEISEPARFASEINAALETLHTHVLSVDPDAPRAGVLP
jgi:type III restriction enzyme